MPYSVPQALPSAPQHAQYQPPHRRNEDNELRTKVTNIEQQLGKMNSILESLVISQQMQNPKPTNCIEETHEQVQAIMTLRSGKKIDKTIAPKRVIQGGEKSKELGGESERRKLEEERKESKGQEHEHDSEPVTKVPDEITVPRGIIENVLIQVDTVYYPIDIIVLDTQPVDCESSKRHIPVILGRPFLATVNAVIHCRHGLLKLSFGNMTLETNIFTVGKQMSEVDQIEEINVIESIIQEHVDREFMEDSIERALVWSEPHDQLESESGVIENLGNMEHGSPTKRSKSKGKAGVDYDASHFTGKNAENLFNKVWIRNGAANIKHEPETEQGKEKLCNWVRGKKLKVTPDTFAEIFEIPREENPEFAFPNVGMPDLAVVSQELLLEGDEWDGEVQCNKTRLKDKLRTRGSSVPFTGFLTELFKRSGVHIPLDFIRIEPEGPIDRASLSRSEGHRKKRKLEEEAQEGSAIGMGELKEAILNLEKRDDATF
ncbi:hypothetical protein Acr_00g0044390 [Actinidia rufa]|uniref:Uncharacterized protein n=1 Tax=Actinidia rufa TaxID=165716 RepID=A0A7J0DIW4_9ERIC|nr:hypothetical protein Acr_00g0044390 [Actinidia rufa]